jgi:lipopolysaccharide transport system ATP-binding protein
MSQTVIKIEHLSKKYRLGVINNGTLFRDIQTWIAIKQGREDPHSQIGENRYFNNKDHFWALKDVSFDIKQGERVGIIGKNGAGKSTLLKLLSRITAPTEGCIKIKGKVASLLEVGTGFHSELTGRENIYLNGAILGMKKRRIDQKLDEIIDFSGIEHHIDTPVKRYSSGMHVRLAFAVAAHLDSDILIADEVLAVGDVNFQKKALGKMQDLSTGQGRTVLFVSHNMGAVEQLCNSGFILDDGKIIYNSNDIKQITKKYFGNDEGEKKYEWHNSGNEFENPWFKPLEFYLTDADGNIIRKNITNNSECWITVRGEIKKIDNALNLGYAIYNSENTLIYWSCQTDVRQSDWPILSIGLHTIRSKLPKRLLNEDAYRLELIGGLYYKLWLFKPEDNSPIIYLSIKGGLSDSPYLNQKRQGILSPIITWEVTGE